MVDYQKLYLELFSEITKTIAALEKVKEETFKKFVESDPSKDEARRFAENMNSKNINHIFIMCSDYHYIIIFNMECCMYE